MGDSAAPLFLTTKPDIRFKLDDVDPPSLVYVARDDRFRVTVTARTVGVFSVTVLIRLLLPNGEIIPNAYVITPEVALTPFVFDIDLAEGYLISLGVTCQTGSPTRGDLFCQVELQRNQSLQILQGLVLISGYISGRQNLSYPNTSPVNSFDGMGNHRMFQGTDPAAGAEIVETVPTGALWRLSSISFELQTDATVSTRTVRLRLGTAVIIVALIPANTSQTASLTIRYTFGDGLAYITSLPVTAGPSVHGIMLPAGSTIETSTNNLQAGDNFTAPAIHVEEWLTVP